MRGEEIHGNEFIFIDESLCTLSHSLSRSFIGSLVVKIKLIDTKQVLNSVLVLVHVDGI